ncbi:hypothetical protein IAT40_007532 [Kwoniella sp. CBS 6097]
MTDTTSTKSVQTVTKLSEDEEKDLWAHLRKKAPNSSTAQEDLEQITRAYSVVRKTVSGRTVDCNKTRLFELDKLELACSLYSKYSEQIKWQSQNSAGQVPGTTEPTVAGIQSDVAPSKESPRTTDDITREAEDLIPGLEPYSRITGTE